MEGNNLSAADVAAVTHPNYGYGYDNGFGGGSGLWLFAILALMSGGNGLFGRGDGRYATVEDLATQSNFTRLENQVLANNQAIRDVGQNLGNGICDLGYEMANKFGQTNTQIAECCCGINRNIDAVRYEGAINTAAINANTTAGIQKILDKLCADKERELYARINQLEMRENFCGVVRYPTQATYAAGFPFTNNCGCGCGYNNNI